MGNSRKATKKMDKQKKKKIYLGIFIAQILAEIFAVAEVISINMVPMKWEFSFLCSTHLLWDYFYFIRD